MIGFTIALLTLSFASAIQQPTLTRFTYMQYHMGVDARIVVYAKDKTNAEDACSAAYARIAELDSIMSDYQQNSELMRLCRSEVGTPVKLSPDLYLVLRKAQDMSRRTDGKFDVTIGPLVTLWRKARKTSTLPLVHEIDVARSLVGWKLIHLDPKKRTASLAKQGMKLDLGGIAKGYAADEAQKVLKTHGIQHSLIEMGGDIVVTGPPPGTTGWTIRVPNAGDDHGPVDMLFANQAVSTSGDTEQFVVIGGKHYSHVVDPKTGWALSNRVQSTVVAPTGLVSDPLSTALTLVPEKDRKKLLRSYRGSKAFVKVFSAP